MPTIVSGRNRIEKRNGSTISCRSWIITFIIFKKHKTIEPFPEKCLTSRAPECAYNKSQILRRRGGEQYRTQQILPKFWISNCWCGISARVEITSGRNCGLVCWAQFHPFGLRKKHLFSDLIHVYLRNTLLLPEVKNVRRIIYAGTVGGWVRGRELIQIIPWRAWFAY